MCNNLFVLILLWAVGFNFSTTDNAILTDSRDGKTYKTMKIGNMTMMAENLNYNIDGSTCFRNSEDFCSKYGRLYNYETAMSGAEEEYSQGICPEGWHIPAEEEWVYIIQNLKVGKLLFKKDSPAHRVLPKNILNFKFAGNKSQGSEKIFLVGKKGVYMSSTQREGQWSVVNFTRKGGGFDLTLNADQHLDTGISCRCIKNE